MKRFLHVLFISCLCVVALTFFVSADDEPTNAVVVQGKIRTGVGSTASSFTFTVNGNSSSSMSDDASKAQINYSSGTCVMTSDGTTTFELFPVSSNFSASTTSTGYSVSYTVSDSIATISITRDSNATSALMGFTLSGNSVVSYSGSYGVSGYSFTASSSSGGGGEETPVTPPSHTMQGLQNGVQYVMAAANEWETYNEYIGIRTVVSKGQVTISDGSTIDMTINDYVVAADMYNMLAYNAYSWSVNDDGTIKFNTGAVASTWIDMIWKYLTYDYYWGTRLWSNDTSGSWYGDIKSSFSYLNYRVNQIFEVLANDEDLKIKDATDEEREWVQDYFENGTDIADSEKYDKLNGTTSAFKDLFSGAPDSSIADGFSTVNDNGYDFWSQAVSDEINGASIASTYSDDPDLQIVDFYSDNFAKIVGGVYD